MGTRAYIYQVCWATKRHLDNKHGALLSCRELHTAQSSPGQRPHCRTPSGARVFTVFLDRGEETVARRPGGFQTVTPPAGVGPAQRPSLRSGPGWLQSSGALQVPQGNALGGRASALPAGSLFLRLLPLSPSPVPVGLSS